MTEFNKKLQELLFELEELDSEEKLGITAEILYDLINTLNTVKIPDGATGSRGPKGDKGDTIVVEKIVETIIEKQPIITEVAVADIPQIIVSKLESLEEDDRLDSTAIKNLVNIHIGNSPPEDKTKLWIEIY